MSLCDPHTPMRQKPAKSELRIEGFAEDMVTYGSVNINTQSGVLSVCKRKFQLTPAEARLFSMFMQQAKNGATSFSAKTGAEIMGYGSTAAFRSALSKLRTKLSDFSVANDGGISIFNPLTIKADSFLLSDIETDADLYSFNGVLAHKITGKHVLNDQQLQGVRIQVHAKDIRFNTGMAVLGDKPFKRTPRPPMPER